MSLVMLVFSVSPILAPLAGSALIVPFGWRAVFVARHDRRRSSARAGRVRPARDVAEGDARRDRDASVLSGYGHLLRDPRFLGLTFIGGLGMASFFAFLASSSFIYIDHYGLTPTQYSLPSR